MRGALRIGWIVLALAACGGPPVDPAPVEPVQPIEPEPEPAPEAATPTPEPLPHVEVAAALFARSLERGRAPEMLRALTRAAPGRAAGSLAHDGAVAWAETTLADLGAQDVHHEPVVVPVWERGERASATISVDGAARALEVLALAGSVGTPRDGLRAEVVRFDGPEALLSARDRAAGRIVYYDRPMRRDVVDPRDAWAEVATLFAEGVRSAAAAKAVAVLIRSPTLAVDEHPRAARVDYGDARWIPAATLAPRAADLLTEVLERDQPVELELAFRSRRIVAPVIASNVVAEIRGLERPEEVVLLAARLDGWDFGQQAHFDGAGVVHCIEALRLLLTSGVRPSRTVRVVLFVDGDQPGRGLGAYARDHADELARHRAVVFSGQGGFAPLGFRCAVDDGGAAAARALVESFERFGIGDFERASPAPRLAPLAGRPLFELECDPQHIHDLRDSVLDRFETVDPRYLRLGCAAVAALAAALANS